MRTLPITVAADADYPLPGLLTLPDGAGPFPAVLLVHGSGPQDRDEAVGPNRPFRDLAVGLADLGVASLRYDKRTFAHGKRLADALQGRLSVEEEVIRDALCAAALLRAEPLIRPDRVYLLGHSMGGMLAPRIDAEGGAFAGLIFWAGTPRTLDALILEQNEASLAAMPPEQRAAAAQAMEEARREATAAAYEVETAQAQQRQHEDAILKLEERLAHFDAQLTDASRRRDEQRRELEQIQARSAQTEADTAAARARIEALEGSAAALRAEAEGKAQGQSELQARTAGIREAIAELNMRRAGLEAEQQAAGQSLTELEALRRDLTGDRPSGSRCSPRLRRRTPPWRMRFWRRNGSSRPSARRTGSGRRPSPASMRRSWRWRPGATRPTSRRGKKTANC